MKLLLIIFGCMLLAGFCSISEFKDTPAAPQRQKSAVEIKSDQHIRIAMAGAETIRKMTRNPSSFQLSEVVIIEPNGSVCFEFRAQNGFGGYNVEHAVIAPERKAMMISEQKGFASLWNKECANKTGTNVTSKIATYLKSIDK